MTNKYLVLILFVLCLGISCETSQRVSRQNIPISNIDSVINYVNNNFNTIHTLNGRYSIDASTNRDEYSIVANVRYVKDSAIWASVFIISGVELARILITPDSIKLIDRIRESFFVEKTENLNSFLPLPLRFYSITDLLIPSLQVALNSKGSAKNISKNHTWISDNVFEMRLVAPEGLTKIGTVKDDGIFSGIRYVGSGFEIDMLYKNYKKAGNNYIPTKTMVRLRGKNKMKAQINCNKFEINIPVSMPFKIPRGYQKMILNEGL